MTDPVANNSSPLPPGTLAEATTAFRSAAELIVSAYDASDIQIVDQTPPQEIIDGIEKFISVAVRLEQGHSGHERLTGEDIANLGDYVMTLLSDLGEWTTDLGQTQAQQLLEQFTMAAAEWIITQGTQIFTLEPVVNAIANLANNLRGPQELEQLAEYMGKIVDAIPEELKLDADSGEPTWSWRVLLLNRSIVATRSHNPEIIEKVFDQLVHNLPEEASRFFSEGMQQMDALNYPPRVREVMQRYFDRFTRHRMH